MVHDRIRKIPVLKETLTGFFDDHHTDLCARMLRRIDDLSADVAALDMRVKELIAPCGAAVERLEEIPGVGCGSAQEVSAKVGDLV
jgi:transposase